MDWLSVIDASHLSRVWDGFAQVPTPGPQVEFLRQQLEFLAKENARQVDLVLGMLPRGSVLVVYTRLTVKYLFGVPRTRFMSPANNPVTLVGMVADAAYITAGMR
jgi:hypothetical protein